jgi:hypothetical protein
MGRPEHEPHLPAHGLPLQTSPRIHLQAPSPGMVRPNRPPMLRAPSCPSRAPPNNRIQQTRWSLPGPLNELPLHPRTNLHASNHQRQQLHQVQILLPKAEPLSSPPPFQTEIPIRRTSPGSPPRHSPQRQQLRPPRSNTRLRPRRPRHTRSLLPPHKRVFIAHPFGPPNLPQNRPLGSSLTTTAQRRTRRSALASVRW